MTDKAPEVIRKYFSLTVRQLLFTVTIICLEFQLFNTQVDIYLFTEYTPVLHGGEVGGVRGGVRFTTKDYHHILTIAHYLADYRCLIMTYMYMYVSVC